MYGNRLRSLGPEFLEVRWMLSISPAEVEADFSSDALQFAAPVDGQNSRDGLIDARATSASISDVRGDMNLDGVADLGDIEPFVLGLEDPIAYQQQYGQPPNTNGDINANGSFDFGDIVPFVNLLNGSEPPAGITVAFIGDQGLGADAVAVLELIRDEGADIVIHSGDFDYEDDPDAWEAQINGVLGANFPYFASIGNHDTSAWSGYQADLVARADRISVDVSGDYGVNSSFTYGGVFFVLSGAGTRGSGHAQYIAGELAGDNSDWSVVSWHKNMTKMQVGTKGNEAGWDVYEAARVGGAIIATGHEHSYSRTKTLVDMDNQVIDPQWPEPDNIRVDQGATFAFVSGLGGRGIRDQNQPSDAYWASIYTSDQGANHGALFITFHVDGQADQARGYFKNIDGVVVDQFDVTSFAGA